MSILNPSYSHQITLDEQLKEYVCAWHAIGGMLSSLRLEGYINLQPDPYGACRDIRIVFFPKEGYFKWQLRIQGSCMMYYDTAYSIQEMTEDIWDSYGIDLETSIKHKK